MVRIDPNATATDPAGEVPEVAEDVREETAEAYESFDFPERPVLPEGVYDVVCSNVEYQYSKTDGSPMYRITFRVLGSGEWEGTTIIDYASFSERAKPFSYDKLNGIMGGTLSRNSFAPANPVTQDAFKGRTLRVRTKLETYNNFRSPKIDRILSPGEGGEARGSGRGPRAASTTDAARKLLG